MAMFTSISERRRGHHAAPMRLRTNPILDAFRDIDDPDDPWGDAMLQLGAIGDVMGMRLETGEALRMDIPAELEYTLEAIGFGIQGHGEDRWPTLIETTFYSPMLRFLWLHHAYAVTERRESFARMLGLDY